MSCLYSSKVIVREGIAFVSLCIADNNDASVTGYVSAGQKANLSRLLLVLVDQSGDLPWRPETEGATAALLAPVWLHPEPPACCPRNGRASREHAGRHPHDG